MKKFLSIIMASIIIFSFVGCNKQEVSDSNNETPENNSTPSATELADSSSETDSEESDDLYEFTIKLFERSAYINHSNKRRSDTTTTSAVIHSDGYSFVSIDYDTKIQANYTEIFDLFNDGRSFKRIARFTMGGIVHTDDVIIMTATDKQITKINGYDAVKFEGFAGDSSQHYIYGYAFVVEDTPCMMTGIVLNYEEHLDMKEAIVKEVEKMAETVRTTR